MKLIIGLGNPGFRYRNTRHNIGFLTIKYISNKFNIPIKKKRHGGLLGMDLIEGEKIALFMPQTYMNLSGGPVKEIVDRESIPRENILVLCDDVDLQFGVIRIKEKGGSAGHRGLESIIESLRTKDFSRLRIGIGRTQKPPDTAEFVLARFETSEKGRLKDLMKRSYECALLWLKEGPASAMNRFNRRGNKGL